MPTIMRSIGRPLDATASIRSKRSASPIEFASPVVPKTLIPSQPFCNSDLQCAMYRA